MRVRAAGPDDSTGLEELLAACPDAPTWPAAAWNGFLAPGSAEGVPKRMLLVATCESTQALSGLVAFTLLEGTTELELLLVHPALRRLGKGRLLSEAWLRWAQQHAVARATLEVRVSNIAAQHLYAALGFRVEGRRALYYREPAEDALLMGNKLL